MTKRPMRLAACAAVGALTALGCGDSHTEPAADEHVSDNAEARSSLGYVPEFPGAGNSGADAPLVGGMICDTVLRDGQKGVDPMTECFFAPGQTQPIATIEQVLECVEGTDSVHLRLTFDPAFVDNSFGANAIGWARQKGPGAPAAAPPGAPGPGMAAPMPPGPGMAKGPGKGMKPGGPGGRGHTWKDLVGSDHAELVVLNEAGEVVSQFKLDYVSQDSEAASGYASLGVLGGDGRMIVGEPEDILEWTTSIDRNLNERGYGEYVVDSPETDADYTPNSATPDWDYRVVYEAWVDLEVFGDSGFGSALIEHVHASPAKADKDTIIVERGPCPCEQDGGCGEGTTPPPPPRTCANDNTPDPNCGPE